MADSEDALPGDSFTFTGTWRDFAPIALTNLALTLVTLGIYRFWAKARERRYLWSKTIFIDDRLEWTGTGREMFVGFLLAILLFALPLFALNFVMQGLVLRGRLLAAGLLLVGLYGFILFIAGFAQFRALRYRLSRSYWHGIRGGSDDNGAAYARSAMWKPVAGALALGLLIPWSMVSLWNQRWNAMSFGPNRFESAASSSGLIGRWILLLLVPVIGLFALLIVFGGAAMSGTEMGTGILILVLGPLLIYGLLAIAGIAYYAAYFREVVGHLSLGRLRFEFDASSRDWLLLLLGDVALVIGTLGIGIAFLGYRHWRFFIDHLGATGEVDLATLTRSTTAAPREAEGIADAFDIGAL